MTHIIGVDPPDYALDRQFPTGTLSFDSLGYLQADISEKEFIMFSWYHQPFKGADWDKAIWITGAVRLPIDGSQIFPVEPGSSLLYYLDDAERNVETVKFHILRLPASDIVGCMRVAPPTPPMPSPM